MFLYVGHTVCVDYAIVAPTCTRSRHQAINMLKAVLALFTGTALGQAIMLAVAPIITRVYTPDEFGLLGMFSSYLAILSLVVCLRFELTIPLPKSDHNAWGIVALCLSFVTVFSLLLALVSLAYGDHLLPLLGGEALTPYIWLLPVGLFLSGSYQVATQAAIRFREYKPLAYTRVIQSLLGALTQVGGGLMGFGTGALLAGQVISLGSGSLRMARVLSAKARDHLRDVNLSQLKGLAIRYKSFAWLASPAALLNGLSMNVPTILVATIYDTGTAGQFFLAQRVLNLPIALISNAVSQSYMGEASLLHRSNDPRIYRLFWKLATTLAALSLVASLCIYFLSPAVFEFVFGDGWGSSGVYASLMAYYLGVRFVTTSLAPTLIIYERQDLSLILQIISAIAVIASFGLAWNLGMAPEQAVTLYSLAMTTPYIIGFFFLSRIVSRHAETN